MPAKGFKLVSVAGDLGVCHGHGHYHTSATVVLKDVHKLIDGLTAKAASTEEKQDIANQARTLLQTIEGVEHIEAMRALSNALREKIAKL
ncbi:hypothetical protein M7784_04695 [Desulfovibrio aminophilus]|nr:hypothetical protein [Desulfovibrio aminophilus]MCM0754543.1 hypothetical protein [Desulfovibrio aminophilus]